MDDWLTRAAAVRENHLLRSRSTIWFRNRTAMPGHPSTGGRWNTRRAREAIRPTEDPRSSAKRSLQRLNPNPIATSIRMATPTTAEVTRGALWSPWIAKMTSANTGKASLTPIFQMPVTSACLAISERRKPQDRNIV